MTSPRVLLVEDHPLMQRAIQNLLSQHCSVICVLRTAEELPDALRNLRPDVLVLDLSLPGRSGLQVLPELRSEFPELGIVIATAHAQDAYRQATMARGADAFVPKDRMQTELWTAVQTALASHGQLSGCS